MKNSDEFVKGFMDELNNGKFNSVYNPFEPEQEETPITDEFVQERVEAFGQLLKMDIIDRIMNDDYNYEESDCKVNVKK